jgi:predicted metal-dependent peptidase
MRRELRRELVKEGQGRGILRGGFRGELAAAVSEEVPWQAVLAQFMSSVRKDDYRLMPPNRRHVWQGIYLPSLGRPGVENLVVVIDTSGSMSEEQLRKVLGEIEHLRATVDCRVTLLQVDAAVADAVVYETHEAVPFGKFTVAGRGGTDFRPAFDWVAQRQREECMHVDALIYLTDGYGAFPPTASYPTLWIYVDTRANDPPFGRVLRIGR